MQKFTVLTVIICTSVIFISTLLGAQELQPTDYLSKEFHRERRDALRKLMPDNSVAVIFSYPERVFSADVNYVYHANPDLYYFSGYKEPEGVLLIFKENQQRGDSSFNELFFIRRRDALQEQWTGRRLGIEGVKDHLGFKYVYNNNDFKYDPIDLSRFREVLYDALPDDVGPGILSSLLTTFKEKAAIKKGDNKLLIQSYNVIENFTTPSNLQQRVDRLKSRMAGVDDIEFKTDPILLELINHPNSSTLASVITKIKSHPFPSQKYNKLVSLLRETKTNEELNLLRKTVSVSAIAHAEVMKAIAPTMSEMELAGMFEYLHKKYGAEGEGYPPIVGAGVNGCILHYEENTATQVQNKLVLMDVASEYHGYSADITRTVPANGKFTAEQKAIYQLVYDAQEEVFKLCKAGTPFNQLNIKATEVLADGLLKLGVIKDRKDVSTYYPHGCSHHMGLDVHDKNVSTLLKENMVITVEPGIYIPNGSPCDEKWWGIAVRIEDDVLIGKEKCEILSVAAPRKVEDVEHTLAKKSVFNELSLPIIK